MGSLALKPPNDNLLIIIIITMIYTRNIIILCKILVKQIARILKANWNANMYPRQAQSGFLFPCTSVVWCAIFATWIYRFALHYYITHFIGHPRTYIYIYRLFLVCEYENATNRDVWPHIICKINIIMTLSKNCKMFFSWCTHEKGGYDIVYTFALFIHI